MKRNKNIILFILFVIVYIISCFTISKPYNGGYFYYNTFNFQLIKSLIVLTAVYIVTILNDKNTEKKIRFTSLFTLLITLIFFIDNYFTKFSGDLPFFRLWWLSIIHLTNVGVYLGIISSTETQDYAPRFLKGYSPIYLLSFIVVFLRPIGDAATTNFIIGKGTFKFIPYLISNPGDSEIWFNLVGNIVFFIPLAFIVKAFIPKIKIYQQIIIGLVFPMFVEGYQFICRCGDVDIDDIVLNFTGFILGLILLSIQNTIINKRRKKETQ